MCRVSRHGQPRSKLPSSEPPRSAGSDDPAIPCDPPSGRPPARRTSRPDRLASRPGLESVEPHCFLARPLFVWPGGTFVWFVSGIPDWTPDEKSTIVDFSLGPANPPQRPFSTPAGLGFGRLWRLKFWIWPPSPPGSRPREEHKHKGRRSGNGARRFPIGFRP